MKNAKHVLFALMLALAVPACASPSGDDEGSAEIDDFGGKEDGVARPEGSYHFDGRAYPGAIIELTLDPGTKTFASTWATFGNGRALHAEQATGTYRFTKSGRNRFIRFTDEAGDLLNRYQYRLSGTTLSLKPDWGDTWFDMEEGSNDPEDIWARQVRADFLQRYDVFIDGTEDPTVRSVRASSLPSGARSQYNEYKGACDLYDDCEMKAYRSDVEGQTVFYVLELRPEIGVATLFDEAGERVASGLYLNSGEWTWQ